MTHVIYMCTHTHARLRSQLTHKQGVAHHVPQTQRVMIRDTGNQIAVIVLIAGILVYVIYSPQGPEEAKR